MILPERVLGKLGASWIKSGWAKGAISSLTIFLSSDTTLVSIRTFSFGVTKQERHSGGGLLDKVGLG